MARQIKPEKTYTLQENRDYWLGMSRMDRMREFQKIKNFRMVYNCFKGLDKHADIFSDSYALHPFFEVLMKYYGRPTKVHGGGQFNTWSQIKRGRHHKDDRQDGGAPSKPNP